jgi:hypothetical protein
MYHMTILCATITKCLYLLWRKLSVITYCRILWRQWPSHIGQSTRHIIHKSSQMIRSGTALDGFLWWRQGVMYSYVDFVTRSFVMFCNLGRCIFKTFCVELEVSCIVWSFMMTCQPCSVMTRWSFITFHNIHIDISQTHWSFITFYTTNT